MIQSREDVSVACRKHGIPDHMWDAVELYLFDRIDPGSFLNALLSNDFMEACGRADDKNIRALRNWAMLIYNELPANCHGSPELVFEWLNPKEGGDAGTAD